MLPTREKSAHLNVLCRYKKFEIFTCVIFIPAAVNFDIKTLLKMFEDRCTPHIIILVVKEIELAVSPVQKNALLNIAHTSLHLEQKSNNIMLHRILSLAKSNKLVVYTTLNICTVLGYIHFGQFKSQTLRLQCKEI